MFPALVFLLKFTWQLLSYYDQGLVFSFPFLFFPLFREVGPGYWSFTRGQNPKPNFWGILLACFSGKLKPMSKYDNLRTFYPETWWLWSFFFFPKKSFGTFTGPPCFGCKVIKFFHKKKKEKRKKLIIIIEKPHKIEFNPLSFYFLSQRILIKLTTWPLQNNTFHNI